jgi:curli biogenesis system outer membrane secretion channel CsgG
MKRLVRILATTTLSLLLYGCATPSTSTGFNAAGNVKQTLPPGVPRKVGVIPFAGDPGISIQATDQFCASLMTIGFDVVERQQLLSIVRELSFQQSEFVNPDTRIKLKEQLGVEGLFVGSMTGESSITWVDAHLNVRLVDVETGRVLWAAEVHDPRAFTLSMSPRTSAIYTVKNAVKILKKDLKIP